MQMNLKALLHFKRTGFDECLTKNDHLLIESTLENFQKQRKDFQSNGIVDPEERLLLQEYERQLEIVQKRYQQILISNKNSLLSDLKLKENHTFSQKKKENTFFAELTTQSNKKVGQTIQLLDGKRVSHCVDCSILTNPHVPLQKPINVFDCRNCKIRIEGVQKYIGSVYLNEIKDSEICLSWDPSLKNQIRMSNLKNCQVRISKGKLSHSSERFVVILEGCEKCVFDSRSQDIVTIKDFDNIMGSEKSYVFSELSNLTAE